MNQSGPPTEPQPFWHLRGPGDWLHSRWLWIALATVAVAATGLFTVAWLLGPAAGLSFMPGTPSVGVVAVPSHVPVAAALRQLPGTGRASAPAPMFIDVPGPVVTAPGVRVTLPGAVVTQGGKVITLPGKVVMMPGTQVTQTVSGGQREIVRTVTVPGPVITEPGPTITVPGPAITVPGPTVTVTEPGPTVTVTVPGPTVTETVPGPTVDVTVTAPPASN